MIKKPQIDFFSTIIDAHRETFNKAYDTVIDQGVSKYPIIVFTSQEIELGIDISNNHKGLWSIRISTLEEFVSKKLIENNKVDDFRKLYSESKDKFCIFFIHEEKASFLFHPRFKTAENVSDS